MQCLREGDLAEGRERLISLIADHPDQIAAYQQLGQSYFDEGEADEARTILRTGIARAKAVSDFHAAAEMDGLLGMI